VGGSPHPRAAAGAILSWPQSPEELNTRITEEVGALMHIFVKDKGPNREGWSHNCSKDTKKGMTSSACYVVHLRALRTKLCIYNIGVRSTRSKGARKKIAVGFNVNLATADQNYNVARCGNRNHTQEEFGKGVAAIQAYGTIQRNTHHTPVSISVPTLTPITAPTPTHTHVRPHLVAATQRIVRHLLHSLIHTPTQKCVCTHLVAATQHLVQHLLHSLIHTLTHKCVCTHLVAGIQHLMEHLLPLLVAVLLGCLTACQARRVQWHVAILR